MNDRPVCHRAEDLVTYLYGEASAADAQDFAAHMKQCDACRAEFAVFNQVHESITLWRNEALGAAFNPAPQTRANLAEAASESNVVQHARRLSGFAALREFFTVSPLWLRGATAFAALLLCVLGVMTIVRMSQRPVDSATTGSGDKVYSQKQLDAEVSKAVDKTFKELTIRESSTTVADAKDKSKATPNRIQLAASQQPKSARRRGLSRQEREQLAADLRLTSAEDEELPFALPEQENPN